MPWVKGNCSIAPCMGSPYQGCSSRLGVYFQRVINNVHKPNALRWAINSLGLSVRRWCLLFLAVRTHTCGTRRGAPTFVFAPYRTQCGLGQVCPHESVPKSRRSSNSTYNILFWWHRSSIYNCGDGKDYSRELFQCSDDVIFACFALEL